MRLGPTLGPRRGLYPRALPPPAGFGWAGAPTVRQLGPSSFTYDGDPRDFMVETSVTRYVKPTGNNGNSGLSWAAAERSIWEALNRVGASATTIYVLGSADPANPTLYDMDHAWISALTANVNVIVVSDETTLAPGYAISSVGMPEGGGHLGTWALGPTEAAVYEATLVAAPYAVIDASRTAADGAPEYLTQRASTAEVQANPGSWYHAAGVLYVRTWDSRDPDASLRPLRDTFNGRCTLALNFYVEGLTFEGGGQRAFYAQNLTRGAFHRCKFIRAKTLGFDLSVANTVTDSTHTVYLFDCEAYGNGGDGVGYTIQGAGETVHFFEANCTYGGNTSTAGSDQGGSAHRLSTNMAVRGVRLNPNCRANKSQGFADVGQSTDGCEVWIVGGSVTDEAVGVYAGNGTKTWLHSVEMQRNTVDLKTDDAAGRIYVTGMPIGSREGAGTVLGYTP
jgi:hypothetical protein